MSEEHPSTPSLSATDDLREILIVRMGALGDIVHAIPSAQLLRRRFPSARIHWLTEPPYRRLLECVPAVDRVWCADTKAWRRRPWTLVQALGLIGGLRGQRFDVALDFQGLLKSAVLARAARPSRLLGFRPERFKERAAGWFYGEMVEGEADLRSHVAQSNLRLASLLCGVQQQDPLIRLEIPQAVTRNVRSRLAGLGLQRPVLLSPGAGWKTKLWPAERFARLGIELQRRGRPVLLTHGPGEWSLAQRIEATAGKGTIPVLPTDLLELAALLRESSLLVAGDTGPLHLACGLGVPVVALMGPTSARRNGPFDSRDGVVQWKLHCSDCYKRSCSVFFCMNLPVYEVLRAVEGRLRKP